MTTNRIIVVLYNLDRIKPNTYNSTLVFQRKTAPSKKQIALYLRDKGIPDMTYTDSGDKVCNFKRLIFCDDDMGINMMLDCLDSNNFPLVCNENQHLNTRIKQVMLQRSQNILNDLRKQNTNERVLYMI